jgi:hypothetical protein
LTFVFVRESLEVRSPAPADWRFSMPTDTAPIQLTAAAFTSGAEVVWKYHHIGNYLLTDVLPPNHGQT